MIKRTVLLKLLLETKQLVRKNIDLKKNCCNFNFHKKQFKVFVLFTLSLLKSVLLLKLFYISIMTEIDY